MKVLSLTQPWAALIAIGAKVYETRSWNTKYRGPLAIHASKGFPGWARDLCETEPFRSVLEKALYADIADLPRGAIVAVVELRATYPTESMTVNVQERAFGEYAPGRFAWELANVREVQPFFPIKGSLGLWEWANAEDELQKRGIVIGQGRAA